MIIEKTPKQKFDLVVRQILPFATALLAALFMATQTHVPRLNSLMPSLTLCVVYFWSAHRPNLFGMGSAFLIGLIQDLVTGVPLGLGALILLLTRAGVATQSRFFLAKPFVVYWWGFCLVALAAAVTSWVMAAMVLGVIIPIGQVLISALLSMAIFPVIFGICGIIERHLLSEDP
ncbi:MAG: rod shape-determining protein MreD [Rhodospirillaceae bacterium]|nr:rod shape-determining protein MreD [Rhodospirillaceae bacterium]